METHSLICALPANLGRILQSMRHWQVFFSWYLPALACRNPWNVHLSDNCLLLVAEEVGSGVEQDSNCSISILLGRGGTNSQAGFEVMEYGFGVVLGDDVGPDGYTVGR